jgi:hypothetical protein
VPSEDMDQDKVTDELSHTPARQHTWPLEDLGR